MLRKIFQNGTVFLPSFAWLGQLPCACWSRPLWRERAEARLWEYIQKSRDMLKKLTSRLLESGRTFYFCRHLKTWNSFQYFWSFVCHLFSQKSPGFVHGQLMGVTSGKTLQTYLSIDHCSSLGGLQKSYGWIAYIPRASHSNSLFLFTVYIALHHLAA